MEPDLELINVIKSYDLLSDELLETLLQRWPERAHGRESLVDMLIREGIVSPQGPQTLALLRQGVLKHVQPRQILTLKGKERLSLWLTKPMAPPPEPARPETINSPQGLPLVGQTLGKCLLTREIATGATASVFEALHQGLQVNVAVKVFRPGDSTHNAFFRSQFQKEARMLAQLGHPHIVRILDFEQAPHHYLVLEYVNGLSLSDLLASTGYLAIPQAVKIGMQTAQALAYAHSAGLTHRDVKPANILVDRAGNVKLADLGISRIAEKSGDAGIPHGILCGTPAYVAPEQAIDAASAGTSADIYSLGATLYHALTGSLPYEAHNSKAMVMRHITGDLISPNALRAEIPDELTALILKMMARHPGDRPDSMDEVAEALQFLLETLRSTPKTNLPSASGNQLQRSVGSVTIMLRRSVRRLLRSP